MTVIEGQFVFATNDAFPELCQPRDVGDNLRDFTESSTGISTEGTTDCAGNTRQILKSRQPCPNRFRNDVRQERARPRTNVIASDFDMAETGIGEANHRTADPFVFDQDVRTATQNVNRDLLVMANSHQTRQFFQGSRGKQVLRRTTQS